MLHILFLISLPVFPIPSVSLPPLRHGTGYDPSCFAQVCLYETNMLECTGMKEGKKASQHFITDQVSLHLCRSQLPLCLCLLFSSIITLIVLFLLWHTFKQQCLLPYISCWQTAAAKKNRKTWWKNKGVEGALQRENKQKTEQEKNRYIWNSKNKDMSQLRI